MKKKQYKKILTTFKLDTKNRPISWSAITQFEYDRELWYEKYVLGIEQKSNQKMDFGKYIDEKIQNDPTFIPEIPRLPLFQHKLTGKIEDIYMVGKFDGFRKKPPALLEYKTTSNKNRWTQKTAQDHGQILFYQALIYLNYGITPEKIETHLISIPCKEFGFDIRLSKEPIQIFKVKHTIIELLQFFVYIKIHFINYANFK